MLHFTLRRGIVLGTGILVTLAGIVAGCTDDTTATPARTSSSGGTSGTSGGTSGTSGGTSGTSGGTSGDAGGGRKAGAQINPYLLQNGTTHGTATFTETVQNNDAGVQLDLTVSQAEPGARGVHVHLGSSCDTDPGGHFNPNATTKNGEWDNIQVGDGGAGTTLGAGTLSSFRAGLTLDQAADGGAGIVGRTLVVHAAPTPQTIDAGLPPPKSGCGVIQPQ